MCLCVGIRSCKNVLRAKRTVHHDTSRHVLSFRATPRHVASHRVPSCHVTATTTICDVWNFVWGFCTGIMRISCTCSFWCLFYLTMCSVRVMSLSMMWNPEYGEHGEHILSTRWTTKREYICPMKASSKMILSPELSEHLLITKSD